MDFKLCPLKVILVSDLTHDNPNLVWSAPKEGKGSKKFRILHPTHLIKNIILKIQTNGHIEKV